MQPANRTTMQTQNVNPATSTSGCGKAGQQPKSKNSQARAYFASEKMPQNDWMRACTNQNFNQWQSRKKRRFRNDHPGGSGDDDVEPIAATKRQKQKKASIKTVCAALREHQWKNRLSDKQLTATLQLVHEIGELLTSGVKLPKNISAEDSKTRKKVGNFFTDHSIMLGNDLFFGRLVCV